MSNARRRCSWFRSCQVCSGVDLMANKKRNILERLSPTEALPVLGPGGRVAGRALKGNLLRPGGPCLLHRDGVPWCIDVYKAPGRENEDLASASRFRYFPA